MYNDQEEQRFLEHYFTNTKKSLSQHARFIIFCKQVPNTGDILLAGLDKFGLWKHYMGILRCLIYDKYDYVDDDDDNYDLITYILHLINYQLDKYLKIGNAKFADMMPREASFIDKNIGFVDKICKIRYPRINKFKARKLYRNAIKQLNIVSKNLNFQITDNNHQSIKYNTLSINCLTHNLWTSKNIDVKNKILIELINRLSEFDIWETD
jgi:hypothetical protein